MSPNVAVLCLVCLTATHYAAGYPPAKGYGGGSDVAQYPSGPDDFSSWSVKGDAETTGTSLKEKAKNTYDKVADKVKDTWEDVKDKTKEVYEKAKDKTESFLGTAKDKLAGWWEKGKENIKETVGTVKGAFDKGNDHIEEPKWEDRKDSFENLWETTQEKKKDIGDKLTEGLGENWGQGQDTSGYNQYRIPGSQVEVKDIISLPPSEGTKKRRPGY